MKKIALFGFITSLIVIGCGEKSPYPGYEKTENGLYAQYKKSNPEARQVKVDDIVTAKVVYKTTGDSVLFGSDQGDEVQMRAAEPLYKGGVFEGILNMHEGDEASFITSADSFFTHVVRAQLPEGIEKGSMIKMDISISKVQSLQEIQEEQQKLAEENKVLEEENIQKYITENNITTTPTQSGLYYIEEVKGNGKKAVPGKLVSVHYKGYLLDGTVFDSSYDRGEPIEFPLGQGAVITGWDEGISYMSVGTKAKLIIPSYLAYGAQQRGPVIKPFSTLVFDVELMDVKDMPQQ